MQKKFIKHLYWMDKDVWVRAWHDLSAHGIKLVKAKMAPCEVLKASGNRVYYACAEIWFRTCFRQSSWYRVSNKVNKFLLASEKELPQRYEQFYEAKMSESDFYPLSFPNRKELQELAASACYQDNKPEDWEKVTLKERILLKITFTLTGFWKWNESCHQYWLHQKANHANFLCQRFTTDLKGESVPYSISDNSGVCSACLELFNVINEKTRKLVQACPGSILAGGLKVRTYYDVQPMKSKKQNI